MQTPEGDAQRTGGTGTTAPPKRGETVVVATRFVVRHRRHTLPFLRSSLASGREAQEVPGFLGGTVLADLWNRRFWTVSVWASPEAVRSYGSAPAHAEAMRQTEHWAAEAQVERWRTDAAKVPSLAETAKKLGVPGPGRGLVRHLRPRCLTPCGVGSNRLENGPPFRRRGRHPASAGTPPRHDQQNRGILMIFLVALALATATSAAVTGLTHRFSPRGAARTGMAIAMAFAGTSHLFLATPFIQHLPPWVPHRADIVLASGLIEIAFGIALLLPPPTRRTVGVALALYLIAVFPGNVYVAVLNVDVDGQPGGLYPWLRLPLQLLFIAWAIWSTRDAPTPTPSPVTGSRRETTVNTR